MDDRLSIARANPPELRLAAAEIGAVATRNSWITAVKPISHHATPIPGRDCA
jgi:hypothetical protein